ncbi:HAD hydrolase-like protein [Flavobacterium sp. '19STA2R22 D10 B1']|uniref:HAD hydrolase-like protein n=1 Tax=Flavobacterium aerium TaxID=3037261 RepID=UPI00278BB92B|nr:HAD hydrolase-like protein [Flavobacterium sp. '19STA2R22 D10 B1']
MQKIELVTFDMAGTTISDKKEVETCFAKATKQTGLIMIEEEILAVQGWSKIFVFETFWQKQLGQRNEEWQQSVNYSFNTFKTILEDHYRNAIIKPTEGCLETFEFLKMHNIQIALTTGFYRTVTDIILDKLGWLEGLNENRVGNSNTIIQASIASDEVENGRPAPDMIFKAMKLLNISDSKKVINIGDTPSDLQSGKNANVLLSLGVINGTHTVEQLKEIPNDGLLNSIGALPLVFESN